MVPYLVLYFSLLRLVDQKHYADAVALLASHQIDLAGFERGISQLPMTTRTEFNLLLVRLGIGWGQLSAPLVRLNRVLALPVRSLPGTLSTQSRLLNLLLYARLGNADYLTHALRSVERKRKKSSQTLTGEQLVIDLLRQWLGGRLTKASLAQTDAFSGSPADRQLLQNLDLRCWIQSVLGMYS
ncbi:hypothetical protein HNV11_10895 [Spirosoma taeanense]|uniref:Uncharacterized protein n=1 Tax=Spirosoma taeanense TaxID=2735870 RepID=A0A6M5Y7H2_9BACT|nr:hypothetical protein [Spirosoma taeanense]QJW89849.1 hypothetical protein HNV11_10895 [Spirosoma taeanense]